MQTNGPSRGQRVTFAPHVKQSEVSTRFDSRLSRTAWPTHITAVSEALFNLDGEDYLLKMPLPSVQKEMATPAVRAYTLNIPADLLETCQLVVDNATRFLNKDSIKSLHAIVIKFIVESLAAEVSSKVTIQADGVYQVAYADGGMDVFKLSQVYGIDQRQPKTILIKADARYASIPSNLILGDNLLKEEYYVTDISKHCNKSKVRRYSLFLAKILRLTEKNIEFALLYSPEELSKLAAWLNQYVIDRIAKLPLDPALQLLLAVLQKIESYLEPSSSRASLTVANVGSLYQLLIASLESISVANDANLKIVVDSFIDNIKQRLHVLNNSSAVRSLPMSFVPSIGLQDGSAIEDEIWGEPGSTPYPVRTRSDSPDSEPKVVRLDSEVRAGSPDSVTTVSSDPKVFAAGVGSLSVSSSLPVEEEIRGVQAITLQLNSVLSPKSTSRAVPSVPIMVHKKPSLWASVFGCCFGNLSQVETPGVDINI